METICLRSDTVRHKAGVRIPFAEKYFYSIEDKI